MQLASSLKGSLSKDNRSLSFDVGGGKVLHYSDLHVFDASNKELDAKLVYTPSQIVIQIDDRNAAYPLTVDPLIYLETEVISSDGIAGGRFGLFASISGNTAVVGAPLQLVSGHASQGEAYVFVRSGDTWTQQATLTAADGTTGDMFGFAAISGDTIVAGAPGHTVNGHAEQGDAYVFVRSGGAWSQQAILTSSDGAAGDLFGLPAISGDTIAVGAVFHTVNGHGKQGEAYVFVRSGGTWSQQAILTSSDGATSDQFGYVAISGNTIVAGAPNHAVNANSDQGEAYVFVKPPSGWTSGTETARLTSSDGAADDSFGDPIAISGNTVVTGASNKTVSGHTYQGEAYVFVEPSSGWATGTETARLTSSDGAYDDGFGNSVAISGDTVAVGGYNHAVNGHANQGEAYVFVKPLSGWTTGTETARLTSSDGAAGDWFGNIVAISGDGILVTAPYRTVSSHSSQGSAYFYYPYRSDQDLAIGATTSSTSPLPNQSVTLTASVTNYGPASAASVLLSAPLPNGFTYVSNTATYGGSYDSSTGSWDVGSLGLGITATLTIQATVNSNAAGTSPTFTASLLGSDTNNANNTASVNLHVPLVSFNPALLNFANQLYSTRSTAQTVTVTNLSGGDVEFGSLSVPAGFALSNDHCSTVTLFASGTCTFALQFSPISPIAYSGNILLSTLNPVDTAALPASGTGVSGTQLLTDRSFETATSKVPNGWTKGGTWSSSDGQDCTTTHSGACSLKFTGTNALKQLSFTLLKSGVAGDDFLFAIWGKAAAIPSGATFDVKTQVYNGATLVTTKTLTFKVGTYGFTRSSLAFTTTTVYTKLVVTLEYKAASGSAWFDDASLLWAP
jgi:uncharacterized repeat protein (TIGR01451 family)